MTPYLSIVVVSFNIPRELPRTLWSLSPLFQEGVTADEYEVIVVDNGSKSVPRVEEFEELGLDLTILSNPDPGPSPCRALNRGLNATCGRHVGCFIDGARLASPGLLARAREALSFHPRAVVGTRGRYLGPKFQRDSMVQGYDADVEDRLLEEIHWRLNGYRLFDISVFDESSGPTWFDQLAESNGLFMSRELWKELGGFDESFRLPGGGLVNLDLWRRACHLPDVRTIALLGEATFHQIHGGVATNRPVDELKVFHDEYVQLRKTYYMKPDHPLLAWGRFNHSPRDSELMSTSLSSGVDTAPRPAAPPVVVQLRPQVAAVDADQQAKIRFPATNEARVIDQLQKFIPPWLVRITRKPLRVAWWVVTLQLSVRLRERRLDLQRLAGIRASSLFDPEWYCQRYSDVGNSGFDPVGHYLWIGGAEGRHPGPNFDACWYLARYPDVRSASAIPLVHYLEIGLSQRREIQPVRDRPRIVV